MTTNYEKSLARNDPRTFTERTIFNLDRGDMNWFGGLVRLQPAGKWKTLPNRPSQISQRPLVAVDVTYIVSTEIGIVA